MKGGEQMQQMLSENATVQGLVNSFLVGTFTTYAIFDQSTIPDIIDTDSGQLELTVQDKTINHMPNSNLSGGLDYVDMTRQVSCRAYTEYEATQIQEACFNALNRNVSQDGNVFFVCESLPAIPAQNSVDNFNAPLVVRIIDRQ